MKNNRIQSVFTLLALGVLLFAGCQKDSMTTLRLRIADFASDSKVYMNGNTPRWVAGDFISINGTRCTIASNGTTTVNNGDVNFKAVYPSNIASFASGAIQLSISQNQSYRTSGNYQVIDAPMAANANAASSGLTTLTFKNIGALLAVTVTNDPTEDRGTLTVDKITVQASGMPLYGTATLVMEQLTNGDYQPVYTINSGQDTNKTIFLNCGLGVSIARNATHTFYISVPAAPPSVVSNQFTIKVHAYNNDGQQSFTRSQTSPTGGNIGVNNVANVPFNFSQATPTTWQPNDIPAAAIRDGLFSVSATKQVYFSAGNLQYKPSEDKWRIAEHQYDYVGAYLNHPNNYSAHYGNVSDGSNYSSNFASAWPYWIDLFGWGTSGYSVSSVTNQAMPYDYLPDKTYGGSADLTNTNYDWGRNGNVIYFGESPSPANTWRTLTQTEWDYLLGKGSRARKVRNNKGIGYTHALVTVEGVPGLLIYPDDYAATNPISSSSSFDSINLDNYPGCAFLPCAGLRSVIVQNNTNYLEIGALPGQVANPIGYYWTATHATTTSGSTTSKTPGYIYFPENSNDFYYLYQTNKPSHCGCSVRLVHDVN